MEDRVVKKGLRPKLNVQQDRNLIIHGTVGIRFAEPLDMKSDDFALVLTCGDAQIPFPQRISRDDLLRFLNINLFSFGGNLEAALVYALMQYGHLFTEIVGEPLHHQGLSFRFWMNGYDGRVTLNKEEMGRLPLIANMPKFY